MTIETFLVIANVPTVPTIVGLVILLIRFNSKQPYTKLLGIIFVASLAATLATHYFVEVRSGNLGSSIYQIIKLPVVVLVYYFAKNKNNLAPYLVLIGIFEAFALYNLFFLQQKTINSYTMVFSSVIVILLSIYYFYWLLQKLPTTKLHSLPMFWINSAWIIFYSGNLFLFIFASYLVEVQKDDMLIYWTLHNILAIIESFMIVIALWMDLRNIKSPS
jgi:hypothetical protein